MSEAREQAEAALAEASLHLSGGKARGMLYRSLTALLDEHKRLLGEVQGSGNSTQNPVDRIRVEDVIHSMIPEEFNGYPVPRYELCEDDSCLWYDIADVLLGVFTITERADR